MGHPRFARQTTTSNPLQQGSRRPTLPYKEAAGIVPSSLPPSWPARHFSGLGRGEHALYASLPRALSKPRDLNRKKPSVLACLWPLPTPVTQPWPSPPRVGHPSSSNTGESPHRRRRKKRTIKPPAARLGDKSGAWSRTGGLGQAEERGGFPQLSSWKSCGGVGPRLEIGAEAGKAQAAGPIPPNARGALRPGTPPGGPGTGDGVMGGEP